MEIIYKKICINDFICRQPNSGTTNWYGKVTGITDNGVIEVYNNSGYTYNSNIGVLPILIMQNIDDIGILTDFSDEWIPYNTYYLGEYVIYNNNSYKCSVTSTSNDIFIDNINHQTNYEWELVYDSIETGNTVTYLGSSRINEFRRYGKTEEDHDLYNPSWNTGFTFIFKNDEGYNNKIINEKESNYSKQNLYDYIIGMEEYDETSGIKYSDIGNGLSNITYKTHGLNSDNSITVPSIKLDYLFGISEEPKINIDVFIDRGDGSRVFDKNIKLSEVKSLDDLENYGNGFFNVKEF